MSKWTWNGWETRASTYAVARRNLQYRIFGRHWCLARDAVDPHIVEEVRA